MSTSIAVRAFTGLILCLMFAMATAHPGCRIMVDRFGQVYFADTAKVFGKLM